MQVVRAAFAYRRKTLANSLALALDVPRAARLQSHAWTVGAQYGDSCRTTRLGQACSPRRRLGPPKHLAPFPTILAVLGALGVVFLSAAVFIGGGVAAGAIDPHRGIGGADIALTLQVAMYLPLAAYVAVILPPLSRLSLHELGLRAPTAGISRSDAPAFWSCFCS